MRILEILCIVLSVVPRLWAQDGHPVVFKTGCISIVEQKYKLYVPTKQITKENRQNYQGNWLEVELNVRDVIGSYKIKTYDGVLRFFDERNAQKKPIASVEVGAPVKDVLFLFVPTKEKKYRIMSVSVSDWPWGHYLMLNLTKDQMMATVGSKKVRLKENQQESFPASKGKSDVVVIAGVEKGKGTVLRETEWALSSRQRELVVYYRDSGSGRIRWKHIVDTKPPKNITSP